jgi:hypothetical protein
MIMQDVSVMITVVIHHHAIRDVMMETKAGILVKIHSKEKNGGSIMEFFENLEIAEVTACPCDDYGYYGGCDDNNSGD